MVSDIQFEDKNIPQNFYQEDSSFLEKIVIKTGLAKNKTEASKILIIVFVVIAIIAGIIIF